MPRNRKMTREEISDARRHIRERVEFADLRLPEGARDIRMSVGLSQEKFAQITGLTKRQVAEIETGKGNPTVSSLMKIGKLFGFELGFVPKEGNRPPIKWPDRSDAERQLK